MWEETKMTGRLKFICVRCREFFPKFQLAKQHQDETGHSVELYRESPGPFKVLVEPYVKSVNFGQGL